MRLDSKVVFIGAQAVATLIATVKSVFVVRILLIEDYAVIGVVEGWIVLAGVIGSMGVDVGLTREVAAEEDEEEAYGLIAAGFIGEVAAKTVAVLLLLAGSAVAGVLYEDGRVGTFLVIGTVVCLGECVVGLGLAILRARQRYGAYLGSLLATSVVDGVVTVSLTASLGLPGYFIARAGTLFLLSLILLALIWRRLERLPWAELRPRLRPAWKRLWTLSAFTYATRLAAMAWRRLPIVLGANLFGAHAIGVATIALDISGKLQLLNQSLSPLMVPLMARRFKSDRRRFLETSMREWYRIVALNLAAAAVMAMAWETVGPWVITRARWEAVGATFHAALLAMLCSNLVWVSNMCVLVPAKTTQGLAIPTIVLRLSVVPILLALWWWRPVADAYVIPLAMLIPAGCLAFLYQRQAKRSLGRLQV